MPKLILDGDSRGAVKAQADLQRAFATTTKEVNLAAKSCKELEKAAERITKENLTPQERYNRRIAELAKLVREGKLSFEQAGLAAERYGVQLDRAWRSGLRAFGAESMAALRNYIGGLASAAGLVAAIKAEWDKVIERQGKVTAAQLGAAEPRDVLKRNIFGMPDAQRDALIAQSEQIAAQTKLPLGVIDTAIAQTISSRSGNVQQAAKFVRYAAGFNRDPESIGEFAGALGDIANALGTNDPQQAMGFMALSAQHARPTDLRQIARNLPKVTQAVRGAGGDPRFGAALFAGITTGAADPQGEISRTAAIRMTEKIGEFFEGKSHGYPASQADEFNEQINILMRDTKLAQKFLDKYSFEAGAQPAIRSMLLDPSSAASRSFESAYAAVGTPNNQRTAGARGVEYLAKGRFAQTRLHEQTVGSAFEHLMLSGDAQYTPERRAEIREMNRRVLGLPEFWYNAEFAYRTGPTLSRNEAITELERSVELNKRGGGMMFTEDPKANRAAEQLLQELRDLSKEQRDELRDIKTSNQSLDRKSRDLPPPSGRQE
jgi:hypothetical protein